MKISKYLNTQNKETMLELTNFLYHKDTIQYIETEIYQSFKLFLNRLVRSFLYTVFFAPFCRIKILSFLILTHAFMLLCGSVWSHIK